MFFYVAYLSFLVIWISLGRKVNNPLAALLFLLLWVVIFSVRGAGYGLDIKTYYEIFIDPSYYELQEKGLTFINIAFSFFSKELIWFSFSYSFLFLSLLYALYRIATRALYVEALFLFSATFTFFQVGLNIYRQGLAVILSLIIMFACRDRRFLGCLLLIFPFMIHKAAVFSLLIFICMRWEFKRWYIIVALVFSVLPFGDLILTLVVDLASLIFPVLSSALGEYRRVEALGLIKASGFDHRNLPIIMSLVISWCVFKNIDRQMKAILWVVSISLIFAAFVSGNVLLYDRIILWAQLLFPLLYVYLMALSFPRWGRVFVVLTYVLLSLFTVIVWGPRNFLGPFEFIDLV